MKMKLSKPIVFFDLETTGTSVETDRIVQIATTKFFPDGTRETKTRLVNPGIPIPPEASDIHGITDEMVADAPTFKQIAKATSEYFHGCDLAGYNSDRFDVPMLIQEFHRCEIEFPVGDPKLIDVMKLESVLNPRTLSAVFFRYTGKELEGAHDAGNDVDGTITVLEHQMKVVSDRFPHCLDADGQLTPESLEWFGNDGKTRFDYSGKCHVNDDGIVCWSFGKHRDKPVMEDRGYLNWVMNANFPQETITKLKKLLISNAK